MSLTPVHVRDERHEAVIASFTSLEDAQLFVHAKVMAEGRATDTEDGYSGFDIFDSRLRYPSHQPVD